MLVLSRRSNEKVLFPTLNVSVQVVAVKPGVVRLGIEAPPEVPVFREEVLKGSAVCQPRPASEGLPREVRHALRNRLNAVHVGLALLRRQIEAGLSTDSRATLELLDREFQLVEQQMAPREEPPAPPVRARRQALVVEDDHNERELLAGFLRIAGLDVATAPDGCDALNYLRQNARPDVVFLDMVLPRCDGPTTLRTIRHDPALADLKVFAMSGYAPQHFGLEGSSSGFDRWLAKPLNPEVLLRDLTQELGLSA